jgi:hypothetical protein
MGRPEKEDPEGRTPMKTFLSLAIMASIFGFFAFSAIAEQTSSSNDLLITLN